MHRAVAFAGTIRASKKIDALFAEISSHYVEVAGLDDRGKSPLECRIQHVDGTFNALERNGRIEWLQRDPGEGACCILTNVRCLSKGVDVPALDAVMFLAPRKSPVDIVQSVGRVMRKSPGKQFGYIILPIGIPSGVPAAQALNDNKRYAAVWEVLQALRAHDERFNAMVNRISLTSKRDDKINVIGVGGGSGDRDNENTEAVQGQLALICCPAAPTSAFKLSARALLVKLSDCAEPVAFRPPRAPI
jgi:predicted helicase